MVSLSNRKSPAAGAAMLAVIWADVKDGRPNSTSALVPSLTRSFAVNVVTVSIQAVLKALLSAPRLTVLSAEGRKACWPPPGPTTRATSAAFAVRTRYALPAPPPTLMELEAEMLALPFRVTLPVPLTWNRLPLLLPATENRVLMSVVPSLTITAPAAAVETILRSPVVEVTVEFVPSWLNDRSAPAPMVKD